MEQGFSDACVSLCLEQPVQNRVAMACRAAAMEMPRPTVRKWCEHGYQTAFAKTLSELANHFKVTTMMMNIIIINVIMSIVFDEMFFLKT